MLWTVLIAKRNIMIITKKNRKKNVMKRIYKGTFYSGLKFDYILIIWYYFDNL